MAKEVDVPEQADNSEKRTEDGSDLSISSKQNIREQLEADIQAFLSSGGNVQHIQPNVTADPPKKPVSNYGSRPI